MLIILLHHGGLPKLHAILHESCDCGFLVLHTSLWALLGIGLTSDDGASHFLGEVDGQEIISSVAVHDPRGWHVWKPQPE